MRFEERAVSEVLGTILMHNVADRDGTRVLKKGTLLTQERVAYLSDMGRDRVEVAVLEDDDVHEDDAARALAEAMQTEVLFATRPTGGRVNLRARADGLLEVNVERLLALNMIPGVALATRRPHTVAGPNQESDNVATLKIIPYAIPGRDLERALALARPRPGIVEVRAFPADRRVALLLVGEVAVHDKLRDAYEPPMRTRLGRLGADLAVVQGVEQKETAIAEAASRLSDMADLIIIAGQTSVMGEEDIILRALRQAGADMTLSGAPVEPGNLLALAYLPGTPVMCAPGCAKGLRRNVVDLVLPRLLLGDRLERSDVALLGLGGFLTAAERSGERT